MKIEQRSPPFAGQPITKRKNQRPNQPTQTELITKRERQNLLSLSHPLMAGVQSGKLGSCLDTVSNVALDCHSGGNGKGKAAIRKSHSRLQLNGPKMTLNVLQLLQKSTELIKSPLKCHR
ncbi:MAG: hypothetical protein AAF468_07075 [Pseudomonadota bacterium]